MISFHCTDCDVRWWPHQTTGGHCPECFGATSASSRPASSDAITRQREFQAEAARLETHARFEVYYAERERRLGRQAA